MERQYKDHAADGGTGNKPAIRFLVQSALNEVISSKNTLRPGSQPEWVTHLAAALMSESEAAYQSVLSSLMANGVSSEEIRYRYVPDTARRLGELWEADAASFVDVTIGTARLQKLFRNVTRTARETCIGHEMALGHAVLMIIPGFEQHSLGAFVAADEMRRQGLRVHMGIYAEPEELVEMIDHGGFSMLGITLATPETLAQAADLLAFLHENSQSVPPIVVGGRIVDAVADAARLCGADHAAATVEEALAQCGLQCATEIATHIEPSR